MHYIKEQGFQLLSYCDMPGVDPQIWFKNAEGKNCWIEVLPLTPGNKPAFSMDGFPQSVLQYDGYVAEVFLQRVKTTGSAKFIELKARM